MVFIQLFNVEKQLQTKHKFSEKPIKFCFRHGNFKDTNLFSGRNFRPLQALPLQVATTLRTLQVPKESLPMERYTMETEKFFAVGVQILFFSWMTGWIQEYQSQFSIGTVDKIPSQAMRQQPMAHKKMPELSSLFCYEPEPPVSCSEQPNDLDCGGVVLSSRKRSPEVGFNPQPCFFLSIKFRCSRL